MSESTEIKCLHVSDLHGKIERYDKLFELIKNTNPTYVFMGGDLLPSFRRTNPDEFISAYLKIKLNALKSKLKNHYPTIFLILGNDDPRIFEKNILELEKNNLIYYLHNKKQTIDEYSFYGYSCVPPTPFLLKDWERYDVSRYVDVGCIHPTEGQHTTTPEKDLEYLTIENDLRTLVTDNNLSKSIFLFHSPPYKTNLDRAALDEMKIDHIPLDLHVGSIAIKRFIEERQPMLTLHGHIHESPRLTGSWQQQIGNTHLFSAAHDRNELSVIEFNLKNISNAKRRLL